MHHASSLSSRALIGFLYVGLGTLAGCSGNVLSRSSTPPPTAAQPPSSTTTPKQRDPRTLRDFSPEMRERIVFVQPWVDSAADRHGLDPALINAVIWVESRFNPRAKSPAGARGLMQLMPATAAALARSMGRHRAASYDPEFNIAAGSLYLARMRHRYHGDVRLALAAYNAGAGNVDKWMKKDGLPPRSEHYVQLVMDAKARFDAVQVLPAQTPVDTRLAKVETQPPTEAQAQARPARAQRPRPEPEIVPEPPVRYDLDRVESTYRPKIEPAPPLPGERTRPAPRRRPKPATAPKPARAKPAPAKPAPAKPSPAKPAAPEPVESKPAAPKPAPQKPAAPPEIGRGKLPSVLD